MHGYPVMQVVQYNVPPCTWGSMADFHRPQTFVRHNNAGLRKYVIWCLICGGISCLLGVTFMGVFFFVRSYTSSVGYFETVPTFVPATLLMLTGLCIISLARRRNRYSYLIKLSGACGLASALTCALVTVTTTVIHMSRLQALKECEYTKKTRTCTCYPTVNSDGHLDHGTEDASVRFVFDASDECTTVHSALYSCLRAIFGLSVAGVLVAVFGCMLVYQLLSHERKKMYWEQLELRCRSLYPGGPPGPIHQLPPNTDIGPAIMEPARCQCRCCDQCHSHRPNPTTYTTPWTSGDNRFWTPTGHLAGHFYPSNLVSGVDDSIPNGQSRPNSATTPSRNRHGWIWSRLPWQRNPRSAHQTPSSPDSQYGFSNAASQPANLNVPDPMIGGEPQFNYSFMSCPPPNYGIWGPPPPYSDPNSPARRDQSTTYQYVRSQPAGGCYLQSSSTSQPQIMMITDSSSSVLARQSQSVANITTIDSGYQPVEQFSGNTLPRQQSVGQSEQLNQLDKRLTVFRDNIVEPAPEETDSNCSQKDGRLVNTLPTARRPKKRPQIDAKQFTADGTNNNQDRTVQQQRFPFSVQSERSTRHSEANYSSNHILKSNRNRTHEVSSIQPDYRIQFNSVDNPNNHLVQRFDTISMNQRIVPQQKLPIKPNLPKDNSRQSMCSVDSVDAKTDYTDLSPMTPGSISSGFESLPIIDSQVNHQPEEFSSLPYPIPTERRQIGTIGTAIQPDIPYELKRLHRDQSHQHNRYRYGTGHCSAVKISNEPLHNGHLKSLKRRHGVIGKNVGTNVQNLNDNDESLLL